VADIDNFIVREQLLCVSNCLKSALGGFQGGALCCLLA